MDRNVIEGVYEMERRIPPLLSTLENLRYQLENFKTRLEYQIRYMESYMDKVDRFIIEEEVKNENNISREESAAFTNFANFIDDTDTSSERLSN